MLKVPGTTKLSLSNSAIKSLYKKPIKRCQGHQHKIGLTVKKGQGTILSLTCTNSKNATITKKVQKGHIGNFGQC